MKVKLSKVVDATNFTMASDRVCQRESAGERLLSGKRRGVVQAGLRPAGPMGLQPLLACGSQRLLPAAACGGYQTS